VRGGAVAAAAGAIKRKLLAAKGPRIKGPKRRYTPRLCHAAFAHNCKLLRGLQFRFLLPGNKIKIHLPETIFPTKNPRQLLHT